MTTALYEQQNYANRQANAPMKLYRSARSRGWWSKIWSTVTGRSRRLLELSVVEAKLTIRGRHYEGMKTVLINQIRGSEGRADDFDIDFYPIRSHTEERWLNIAAAKQHGVTLPAVELVQAGNIYFVRDGHHRISVARAMGQEYIEARVTVWEVSGPMIGERLTSAPVLGYTAS